MLIRPWGVIVFTLRLNSDFVQVCFYVLRQLVGKFCTTLKLLDAEYFLCLFNQLSLFERYHIICIWDLSIWTNWSNYYNTIKDHINYSFNDKELFSGDWSVSKKTKIDLWMLKNCSILLYKIIKLFVLLEIETR
jgi:hypothetical protein